MKDSLTVPIPMGMNHFLPRWTHILVQMGTPAGAELVLPSLSDCVICVNNRCTSVQTAGTFPCAGCGPTTVRIWPGLQRPRKPFIKQQDPAQRSTCKTVRFSYRKKVRTDGRHRKHGRSYWVNIQKPSLNVPPQLLVAAAQNAIPCNHAWFCPVQILIIQRTISVRFLKLFSNSRFIHLYIKPDIKETLAVAIRLVVVPDFAVYSVGQPRKKKLSTCVCMSVWMFQIFHKSHNN